MFTTAIKIEDRIFVKVFITLPKHFIAYLLKGKMMEVVHLFVFIVCGFLEINVKRETWNKIYKW